MSKSRGLFNLQSLQVRITLGVLVVSLLALWSAVLILDRTLRRDMESSISAQQFSAVSLIAAELDRSIGERQQIVKTIADNYRSTLLSDSPAAQAALEQYPLPDSIFNWGLIILDKQGVAVASVPRDIKRTGVSFLDYPHTKEVLNGAGSVTSDPLFSEHSQQPVVVMMSPIHDQHQQVIGIVVGVTNLKQPNFLDQIGRSKYGTTGDFLITAPKTRSYVTASDKAAY